MLASKNETMKDTVFTLLELNADDKVRLQCEACERIERDLAAAESFGEKNGLIRGQIEGQIKGIKEGHDRLSALNLKLLDTNRLDDLKRAATDAAYCQQLFDEFQL